MDPSWCPGCDRLILPKRFLVPINNTQPTNQPTQLQSPPPPPPPPASTPVPSSPQVRKRNTRQTKRLGGGLVEGTGRGLRPAPAHKSSNHNTNTTASTSSSKKEANQSTTHSAPQPQRKSRVVISQDPTPLYCSEECRARDLKNSFIESDSAGFAGAPAALNHIAKLEQVHQLEMRIQRQRNLTRRHSSNTSPSLCESSTTTSNSTRLPTSQPSISAPPPKHKSKHLFRTSSYSSTSTASTAAKDPKNTTTTTTTHTNKTRTVRPSPRRNSSTSMLFSRAPTWGSPTKASLAPPATNLFTASSSSSCSLDSATNTASSLSLMSVSMSSLFEGSPLRTMTGESVDTEGTTPSGASGSVPAKEEKKKPALVRVKRVSFLGDGYSEQLGPFVESPEEDDEKITSTSTSATQIGHRGRTATSTTDDSTNEDWRARRRNPVLDAHPLLEALSVSPKDRIVRPASLPVTAPGAGAAAGGATNPATTTTATTTTTRSHPPHHPPTPLALPASHSTPAIPARSAHMRRSGSSNSASAIYKVAMWPEDEKRTTESARVHGDLLRAYAKRFGPREGRSLVWSQLWVCADRAASTSASPPERHTPLAHATSPISPIVATPTTTTTTTSPTTTTIPTFEHEAHSDSDKSYWAEWESHQAALRARRKAESEVARLEEERVIKELLDGAGMREEDQPQARRMRRMAYDGMPGPAELRGLTYRFDRFLYDLADFTGAPNSTTCGGEEALVNMQSAQDKKRLFNFEE